MLLNSKSISDQFKHKIHPCKIHHLAMVKICLLLYLANTLR